MNNNQFPGQDNGKGDGGGTRSTGVGIGNGNNSGKDGGVNWYNQIQVILTTDRIPNDTIRRMMIENIYIKRITYNVLQKLTSKISGFTTSTSTAAGTTMSSQSLEITKNNGLLNKNVTTVQLEPKEIELYTKFQNTTMYTLVQSSGVGIISFIIFRKLHKYFKIHLHDLRERGIKDHENRNARHEFEKNAFGNNNTTSSSGGSSTTSSTSGKHVQNSPFGSKPNTIPPPLSHVNKQQQSSNSTSQSIFSSFNNSSSSSSAGAGAAGTGTGTTIMKDTIWDKIRDGLLMLIYGAYSIVVTAEVWVYLQDFPSLMKDLSTLPLIEGKSTLAKELCPLMIHEYQIIINEITTGNSNATSLNQPQNLVVEQQEQQQQQQQQQQFNNNDFSLSSYDIDTNVTPTMVDETTTADKSRVPSFNTSNSTHTNLLKDVIENPQSIELLHLLKFCKNCQRRSSYEQMLLQQQGEHQFSNTDDTDNYGNENDPIQDHDEQHQQQLSQTQEQPIVIGQVYVPPPGVPENYPITGTNPNSNSNNISPDY